MVKAVDGDLVVIVEDLWMMFEVFDGRIERVCVDG